MHRIGTTLVRGANLCVFVGAGLALAFGCAERPTPKDDHPDRSAVILFEHSLAGSDTTPRWLDSETLVLQSGICDECGPYLSMTAWDSYQPVGLYTKWDGGEYPDYESTDWPTRNAKLLVHGGHARAGWVAAVQGGFSTGGENIVIYNEATKALKVATSPGRFSDFTARLRDPKVVREGQGVVFARYERSEVSLYQSDFETIPSHRIAGPIPIFHNDYFGLNYDVSPSSSRIAISVRSRAKVLLKIVDMETGENITLVSKRAGDVPKTTLKNLDTRFDVVGAVAWMSDSQLAIVLSSKERPTRIFGGEIFDDYTEYDFESGFVGIVDLDDMTFSRVSRDSENVTAMAAGHGYLYYVAETDDIHQRALWDADSASSNRRLLEMRGPISHIDISPALDRLVISRGRRGGGWFAVVGLGPQH